MLLTLIKPDLAKRPYSAIPSALLNDSSEGNVLHSSRPLGIRNDPRVRAGRGPGQGCEGSGWPRRGKEVNLS